MSQVVTQEGAQRLLQWMLSVFAPILPTLHLLGQPYQPLHTSLLTNFAANEVAPGIGYAATPLSSPRAGWGFTGLPNGYQAQYLTLSWTFTGSAVVYGYYVSDDTLGVSLWGELLAQSYPVGGSTPVFALNVPVQLTSQPATS